MYKIFSILEVKSWTLKWRKTNLFETHECKVCLEENETQEHLCECKKVWKLKNTIHTEYPNYEKISWGNVNEKVEVSRIYLENMKIREKSEENPKWCKYKMKVGIFIFEIPEHFPCFKLIYMLQKISTSASPTKPSPTKKCRTAKCGAECVQAAGLSYSF